jgi:ribosomal protein L7/L12
MLEVFKCPNCGATLPYEGGPAPTVECQFCGTHAPVPEELRAQRASPGPEAGAAQLANLSLSDLPLKQAGDIAQLVRAGKKIEAIKLYRELTGEGLKESKDAIEALESGQVMEVSQALVAALSRRAHSLAPDPSDPGSALREIRRLLSAGNKIEAIKIFRQTFGVGLKEAKDAVEAIEAGQTWETLPSSPTPTEARPASPLARTPRARQAAQPQGCVILGFIFVLAIGVVGVVAILLFTGPLAVNVGPIQGLTPTPNATATLSGAQLDATSGAIARVTRQAQATLDAFATATERSHQDATSTARAAATEQAVLDATVEAELQALAEAMSAAQSSWPVVVVETFQDNRLGWPLGTNEDEYIAVEAEIAEGTYRWIVTPKESGSYWNLIPEEGARVNDFYASVEVRHVRGGEEGVYAYGLVFRQTDDDYGFFGIQNDGHYRILMVDESSLYVVIVNESSAIQPGRANRLTVRAIGSDFIYLINDQVVWHLNWDLAPGTVGLGVDVGGEGREAQVEFAHFEVHAP